MFESACLIFILFSACVRFSQWRVRARGAESAGQPGLGPGRGPGPEEGGGGGAAQVRAGEDCGGPGGQTEGRLPLHCLPQGEGREQQWRQKVRTFIYLLKTILTSCLFLVTPTFAAARPCLTSTS